MDKSWMNQARYSGEYLIGLETFLNFAFDNARGREVILCPCKECKLSVSVERDKAREHLLITGFFKGYNQWVAHGEVPTMNPTSSVPLTAPRDSTEPDDIQGLLHDVFGIPQQNIDEESEMGPDANVDIPSGVAEKFYKLLEQSKKPLYEGCDEFSKVSFIVHILHIKCMGKWSNRSFDSLLEFLGKAFPEAMAGLPATYYECEKFMKDLGIGYEKIDACVNDCMLYWGDNVERTSCKTCNHERWKTSEKDPTGVKRKIGHKILWYFPIKPRLQRLFMSSKTAKDMRWHADNRTKDGYMRHPADSPAWKTFDSKYPEFANDPQNVRLGLASDGFNPFSNMSTSHSTWPVVLVPYNLPPWMCMKEPFTLLSLLIPGPSAPGNDIDVYMQPLISDLKDLWENGVKTYDASVKKNFQLHASLLWTISDFPGYANLSGWSTKGKLACPVCHEFTHSLWLKNSGKFCYMGHRRFLDQNHPFRRNSQQFDGKQEKGRPPPRLSGAKVLESLKNINFKFGKEVKDNPNLPHNWKKKSILFDLPYWKDVVLRHNLDFMHIEKNVAEKICGTLLNMANTTKDNEKARLDLKAMGIRPELHPTTTTSGRTKLPAATYNMDSQEKSMFCNVLKNVKVPDGYASNISRCVHLKPPKLIGLKSHDYHIIIQQLLPVAVRKTLKKSVRVPLIKLSRYFRELCSKVINPVDVIRLEKDIVLILCQLERIFPPSFFDVMVHLTIHLATEVKLGGPVYYRWMYPIERYLGTLKSYVRNQNKPEGSIAQGYIANECLTWCSMYLADCVQSKFNSTSRNEDAFETNVSESKVFIVGGHPLGKGTPKLFDAETLKKGHQYVLFNCEAAQPYIQYEQHRRMVKENNPRMRPHQIERIHYEQFAEWFSLNVNNLDLPDDDSISSDLKVLAKGPNNIGLTFDKYIVNGFRFHAYNLEKGRTTQNSGVTTNATISSFSSTRDVNPVIGETDFYGVLNKIIELDYVTRRVVLFDCDWVSKGTRLKLDSDGFTLANFKNVRRHEEPFILAHQARQVFYIADPVQTEWKVVITTSARGSYKMEPLADVETYLQSNLGDAEFSYEKENVEWVRLDVEGEEIENEDVE